MNRSRARTIRRATERENRRQGKRAEMRGRTVAPTLEGFLDALHSRGHDGIAEALISRSNQRLQRIEHLSHLLQSVCMPSMACYLPFDYAVRELGGHPGRGPFHSGETWIDHLAWGLDSVAQAVRLLLCLQPVGAAVIARTQLERWSSNVEFSTDLSQQPNEDTVAWFNRLWSQPGSPVHPGGELGHIQVGRCFADLSELLHGRGPLMSLVWLDVADVAGHPSVDHIKLIDAIADSLSISLSRVRDCIATVAADASFDVLASTVHNVRLVGRTEGWARDSKVLLYPLTPGFFLQRSVPRQLGAVASGHHRVIESLLTGRNPDEPPQVWPALSFGERRFRAATIAQLALEHERVQLAEDFKAMGIDNLYIESVLACEMTGLLASWLSAEPGLSFAADALALCASALRSAVWLWLEDDDRAMGCLRPVVEQLARARTWRIKPEAATRIEANARSTPRDWIERAGWKRLNLLNRALGEFVHGSTRANTSGAWEALVALQDSTSPTARFTGRTHAVTAMIHFVQVEAAKWLEHFDDEVASGYWRVVRLNEERASRAIELLANRAWSMRDTKF